MGKRGLSGRGDMAQNQAQGLRFPGRGLGKSSSLTEIIPVNAPTSLLGPEEWPAHFPDGKPRLRR